MNKGTKSGRLLSLDVMRGLTVAGMILVNDPGSWDNVYAPLRHAEWNGLTPTDLVFPFFMFMMGVSIFASLRKFDFKPSWNTILRILRRTVSIYAVAMLLALFGNLRWNGWQLGPALAHLRLLGVLPRFALCYLFGSLTVVLVPRKYIKWVIAALLVGYYAILLACHGFIYGEGNTLCAIDIKLWGTNHMYLDRGIEPEGLLSTIPAIAHTLIGFTVGGWVFSKDEKSDVLNKILLYGAVLTMCGLLLSYGCPINKKVWSPTFVLVTCGFGSLLLGLLYWWIDIREHRKGWAFAEAFGVNAIFSYVIAGVLCHIIDLWPVYQGLEGILTPCGSSLFCAILFVLICWIPAFVLYKCKVYIKL